MNLDENQPGNEALKYSDNFQQAKRVMSSMLKSSLLEEEISHSQNTLKWLLILRPDADEVMQLAAQFHDIERSQPDRLQREKFATIEEYKDAHAERSAEIAKEVALKSGYSSKQAESLYDLISHHESGGSEDVETIMDADSLSFFENNLPYYITRNSPEAVKEKVKFMYSRMSDKSRSLTKSLAQNNPLLQQVL